MRSFNVRDDDDFNAVLDLIEDAASVGMCSWWYIVDQVRFMFYVQDWRDIRSVVQYAIDNEVLCRTDSLTNEEYVFV